jgi:hypothetical protein
LKKGSLCYVGGAEFEKKTLREDLSMAIYGRKKKLITGKKNFGMKETAKKLSKAM